MKQRLLLIVAAFLAVQASAQTGYWKAVSSYAAIKLNKGMPLFKGNFQPAAFKLFTLDEHAIRTVLALAPYEKTTAVEKSGQFITVPLGDGTTMQFSFVEAPVMEPGLYAKYPQIRSYIGKGTGDKTATLRCCITSLGFSGMITRPGKPNYYISSVNNAAGLYAVYDRDDKSKASRPFECKTETASKDHPVIDGKPSSASGVNDGVLRTYRFAVESGAEFSKLFLDGTEADDAARKAKVLSALVIDLVRINGVFETDFGVRLQYVNNEDTIIFLNGKTDPFTPGILAYLLGRWNTQSQQTLDKYIGNANYDVGHLLMGTPAGGNAGCIGCVCVAGQKGSGATGFTDDLTADPFVIDFWAHEIGHQFGANHTFDYQSEGTIAQIEPGSGSTIMGYAGTTGANDVQPHSDPYFSAASIQQVTTYIQSSTGDGCAVKEITNNNPVTANGGADYTIPQSTPFILTGTGSDGDASDALSYCWEQNDVFKTNGTSSSFPSPTSTTGPQFRSYIPLTNGQRMFPSLASILDGGNANQWEVLPAVSRLLNFRLTVRDNHPGNGNTASDDVKISVTADAGPFKITSPNNDVTIPEGSTQTITWDVANTDAAPVSCTNVKISLSLDGGISFPYTLAASTPNDGSEDVTVPLIPASTTAARIKIESVGNIFFDISDVNFSVDGTLPLTWLSFTAERSGTSNALLKWTTANEINNNHFDIERSTDGTSFNKVATMAAGKNSSAQQQYSYLDKLMPKGIYYYRIKQVDNDGHYTYSAQVRVTIDASGVSWSFVPNPAKDHITISIMTGVNPTAISISGASGKTVYANNNAAQLAAGSLDIPLNRFANGTYFIKVITAGGSSVQKLVVEK